MELYDYLIVGSGLCGSVMARQLTDSGKRCLVIDGRAHIGGNCYTEEREGINVHTYGAHIFHTSSLKVWEYINKFASFNHYVNRPKVFYKNKIYSFPINLMTLYQLWGVTSPKEAIEALGKKKVSLSGQASNLEEWVLSQVGQEIYETFIEGYTAKQWGTDPSKLPASIIKRLPIRLNFDDNYFNDCYQGIPIGGYTKIFERLLSGIEVKLNVDYFKSKEYLDGLADRVIYTGEIDRFFDYQFGRLSYRSLRFDHELHEIKDFQGNAVINYTEKDIPYTRIIEHKHFEFGNQDVTIITKEYPDIYTGNNTPYYPVNDAVNNKKYESYAQLARNNKDRVIFAGRLAEYKYYDMHQVIGSALVKSEDILSGKL